MKAGKKEGSSLPLGSLLILIIGSFMALLDSSIVNVTLPRLMSIFGVGYSDIEWVMTAYLLASGAVIPVSGYLADRFGAKRVYLLTLALFTVGSLLCALAWNVRSLIFFRVLQAIGGGAMLPLGMAMIYRLVPHDRIGAAMGTLGISMVAAPAIGPTLGGYLTDSVGWEFIFLLNVPIGIIALLLGTDMLKELPYNKDLKFDFLGFFLITTACVLILLALNQGESKGWTSYYIVTLFFWAFSLAFLFVLWELDCPHPMINIRLFTNAPYVISLLALSSAVTGLFSAVYLVPFYCQNLRGLSATDTGLILMPAALVAAILMPVTGPLFDRVGAAPLGIAGLALVAATTYWLHHLTPDTSVGWIKGFLAFRSIGLGLCMMPLTAAGMNAVAPAYTSQASAMQNTIRMIAASLSIAYITHVLTSRQAFHQVRLAEGVSQALPAAENFRLLAQGLGAGAGDPAAGQALAAGLLGQAISKQAFMTAIGDTFIISALLVTAAIPFAAYLTKERVAAWRTKEIQRYGAAPQISGPPAGQITH